MNKQRATNTEEKQARRQRILESAAQIFQQTSFNEVTMAAVAAQCKLAKGTLFLYFSTKEELFLALVEEQLREWFDKVDVQLDALEDRSIPAVAALFAGSLIDRPTLTRLLAIHATILEQNVSYASIAQFKRFILLRLAATGARLEKALPFLQAGQGAHLLLQCQALVVGLWHLSDPSAMAAKVIQQEGLSAFDLNFNHEFQAMLTSLLYGLKDQANLNKGHHL